jgi:hypothetical protein
MLGFLVTGPAMQDGQIPVVPVILVIFAIVAFLMFVGVIVLLAFIFSRAAKRRSYDKDRGQQMQQVAGQMGFAFQPLAELSAVPFFSNFELFEGDAWRFENLLVGKVQEHDVVAFDLAYRNVGGAGGRGTTTSRQTMYAISSNELKLPQFYLRPEGVLEKALNALSRVDIDLAERPNFSRMFLLYGNDEAAIRRMFTGRKVDLFEQNPTLSVFGGGRHLFLYQSRTLAPPAQVPQSINFLTFLNELFR